MFFGFSLKACMCCLLSSYKIWKHAQKMPESSLALLLKLLLSHSQTHMEREGKAKIKIHNIINMPDALAKSLGFFHTTKKHKMENTRSLQNKF